LKRETDSIALSDGISISINSYPEKLNQNEYMSIISNLFIISSVSFLLFCSKPDKTPSPEVAELTFEVDSTKLELPNQDQDLGIQFNAPKGWILTPKTLLEAFSNRDSSIFLEEADFKITPISICLNQETRCLLYISKIHGIQDSASVDKYKDLIQRIFSPTKVGDFLKDNIRFTQYLIQDERRVNFKLLFFNSKNQLIQFDYIVPKDVYLSELKAIESSIGSIKLIEQLTY
jgi:hypothetical protein